MRDKYGFCISDEKFERTYRTGSNLDDMHENGIHDYLKYIKFGYGRCTDHASKDIRSGDLTRAKGIQLVKAMDHIKPKDLYRWLDYVGMEEGEFDRRPQIIFEILEYGNGAIKRDGFIRELFKY